MSNKDLYPAIAPMRVTTKDEENPFYAVVHFPKKGTQVIMIYRKAQTAGTRDEFVTGSKRHFGPGTRLMRLARELRYHLWALNLQFIVQQSAQEGLARLFERNATISEPA